MGVRWDDRSDVRRRVPASRALRPAPGFRPLDGPTGKQSSRTRRLLPGSVYRQYLDGLARIHQKGN